MKKNTPKVSVMIPTYNQEQYIACAIESVLMQNYENLEIVISDDCSTDSTPNIIRKYISDKRIKFVRNKSNMGRVGNYHNTLYNHTTGDWIINLDGDDYYTDNYFISRAINNISVAQKEGYDIVAYLYKQHHLKEIKKKISHKEIEENCLIMKGKDYFINYNKIGGFGHMNTIYRKDKAIELGDCYTKLYQASDFHSIIRIIIQGDILIDSRQIGIWRVHGNNATINEVNVKYKDAMQTFDDIENYASKIFTVKELSIWRKKANQTAYYDYVSTYIHSKRNLKSFYLLIKSFKLKYSYFRLLFYYIFKK